MSVVGSPVFRIVIVFGVVTVAMVALPVMTVAVTVAMMVTAVSSVVSESKSGSRSDKQNLQMKVTAQLVHHLPDYHACVFMCRREKISFSTIYACTCCLIGDKVKELDRC